MTKLKHTKTNWEAVVVNYAGCKKRPIVRKYIKNRHSEGQGKIAVCYGGNEKEANARLIAAAPELLEALEAMVNMLEHSMSDLVHSEHGAFEKGITDIEIKPDGSLMLSDARKAIKKARGGS